MKVEECMCCNVNTVKPETTLKECAEIMSKNDIGCTPVCEEDKLVGMITDRDIILRAVAEGKDINTTTAKDIMTEDVCSCDCGCSIDEAEKIMSEYQIRRIPIIEEGKVVGMLTLGDLAINNNADDKEVCKTFKCICED